MQRNAVRKISHLEDTTHGPLPTCATALTPCVSQTHRSLSERIYLQCVVWESSAPARVPTEQSRLMNWDSAGQSQRS